MIPPTNQLNDIVRNFSKEHAIQSLSQLASIIDLCSKAGIRFSYDKNYDAALASFTAHKFPEWSAENTNREIESLANQGKFEESVVKREETITLQTEIQKGLRLEQYVKASLK